jgi:Signal recognition particle GTPase
MATPAAARHCPCARSRTDRSNSQAQVKSSISLNSLFQSGSRGGFLEWATFVSLVEKAAEAVEAEDAARLERKLRTASFDFNDFLAQFKMMRRMGPLENILGMLPGMSNVQGLSIDEKQLKRTEAIVLSMTKEERTRPDILMPGGANASRAAAVLPSRR